MNKSIFTSTWIFLNVLLMCSGIGFAQVSPAQALEKVIDTVSNFRVYDYAEYPLGRHLEALEKQHADFH